MLQLLPASQESVQILVFEMSIANNVAKSQQCRCNRDGSSNQKQTSTNKEVAVKLKLEGKRDGSSDLPWKKGNLQVNVLTSEALQAGGNLQSYESRQICKIRTGNKNS